jgi:hypothetical protein
MESENKVLRQQAVAISPTAKALAAYPKSPFQVCHVRRTCILYKYIIYSS